MSETKIWYANEETLDGLWAVRYRAQQTKIWPTIGRGKVALAIPFLAGIQLTWGDETGWYLSGAILRWGAGIGWWPRHAEEAS